MEIKEDFGKWLRARRKAIKLYTTEFSPIDASTMNRIENGKAHARFYNAVEILRILNVDFPEFIQTFLGIDIDTVRAIQQSRQSKPDSTDSDGRPSMPLSMTLDRFVDLVSGYANQESSVTRLIGVCAIRIGFFHDKDWSRFHPDDTTHAEQLGEWISRSHAFKANEEWKRPNILDTQDRVLDTFYEGGIVVPEDAFVALADTVGRYNMLRSQDDKLRIAKKFNRDRLVLNDLLQTCTNFSEEDAVKTLDLFWYAFKLDSMISMRFADHKSSEIRHLKEVGALLVTLWRWLRYMNDHDRMQQFINTARSLDKPNLQ